MFVFHKIVSSKNMTIIKQCIYSTLGSGDNSC